jgi:hypothetical protein
MRRRLAIFTVIGATLAALAVGGIGVLSASAQGGNEDNVTLCHATDSATNPYVVITIDQNGIDNINTGPNGHGTHTGPLVTSEAEAQALKDQHIQWGDIIPAFNIGGVNFPGLNNTPAGLAILANGCNFVTPVTPTTAPSTTAPSTTAPSTTAPSTTAPKAPSTTAPGAAPSAPSAVVVVPRVTG